MDNLITYVALFAMAVAPIYVGSRLSVKPAPVVDSLSAKDAYMFPVVGSCVLFGLYLLFKFVAKEWINFLMSFYFSMLGIGAVMTALTPLVRRVLLPRGGGSGEQQEKPLIDVKLGRLPSWLHWLHEDALDITLTLSQLVALVLGASVGLLYLTTKHWIANNVLGESFSVVSIELISLGSFKVGCILLVGLFFYDIFWVFGTDVMITVAKSFDAPIKVIWPRGASYSLLGLGDIVIPGVFIALMLRFDAELHRQRLLKNRKEGEPEPPVGQMPPQKPYFHSCLVGYVLGLTATMVVLHVFQHGQPALLYLVPGCIGSVLFTAVRRGELSQLFAYHDPEPPAEPEHADAAAAVAGTEDKKSQ